MASRFSGALGRIHFTWESLLAEWICETKSVSNNHISEEYKSVSLIGGQTRPAMSVVAKAVEEDYRSRLRGLGVWCWDDDR